MSDYDSDLLDILASRDVPEGHTDGAQQAVDNADEWWRSTALLAIRELAATGREFTADDIRDLGVTERAKPRRGGARARPAEAVGGRVPHRRP